MADNTVRVEIDSRAVRCILKKLKDVKTCIAGAALGMGYYIYKNEKEKKELEERIADLERRH